MGTEDPGEWREMVTTLGQDGGKVEVEVEVWKLKITGRFDALGNWLEAYLAYSTLGIHGGPLDRMHHFLVSKITGFLDDLSVVLEVDQVIKIWDTFYILPDEVDEEGAVILRKVMAKIGAASKGNVEMERFYVYGFRDSARGDLVKLFLGVMIKGAEYPLPPKPKEERLPEEAVEKKFGPIPTLVLEGESSKGLNWRNVEPRNGVLEGGCMFIGDRRRGGRSIGMMLRWRMRLVWMMYLGWWRSLVLFLRMGRTKSGMGIVKMSRVVGV